MKKEKEFEEVLLKHSFPPDVEFQNSLGCHYILLEEQLDKDLAEDLKEVLRKELIDEIIDDCKVSNHGDLTVDEWLSNQLKLKLIEYKKNNL